jgi:hypothetical protein
VLDPLTSRLSETVLVISDRVQGVCGRVQYGGGVGEYSDGVDTWRDEPVSRPPVGYLPYADRKPYVVADTLTALNGPTRGVVMLPRHLDWSGHAEYELSRPAHLASMYKIVVTEAGTVEDLYLAQQ